MGFLVTVKSEKLGANEGAVLGFRLMEQLLHHLIACRLALTVSTFRLTAVESDEGDDAGDGTTHHTHTSYSTSKAGCDALGKLVVNAIEVGEGCHYRLTTTVTQHEEVDGATDTLLKFGGENGSCIETSLTGEDGAKLGFILLAVLEDDAVHAVGSGCLDVVLTVVSEDTLLGAQVEAAAEDVINLALGLDDVFLRRDDASVEEAEDGELLHGLMYAAAPVGEAVETISLCLEAGEEIAHSGYLAEDELCIVGADRQRDASTICVVENIRDVMAVEHTQQYRGLYHVLGGIISPMDGIGPSDIEVDSLVERVANGGVKEVILALSSTMEGDTTNFYISRKLSGYDVVVSVIARGISVGDELEYTDEVTLGRALLNRTVMNNDNNER